MCWLVADWLMFRLNSVDKDSVCQFPVNKAVTIQRLFYPPTSKCCFSMITIVCFFPKNGVKKINLTFLSRTKTNPWFFCSFKNDCKSSHYYSIVIDQFQRGKKKSQYFELKRRLFTDIFQQPFFKIIFFWGFDICHKISLQIVCKNMTRNKFIVIKLIRVPIQTWLTDWLILMRST